MDNETNQRHKLIPTKRRTFNYANDESIDSYNSFNGSNSGGNIMPSNELILTNDNSTFLFATNFDSGFNTVHDITCVFDGAILPESRNASDSSANGSIAADTVSSSLLMQSAADGTDQSLTIVESKNYIKMPQSGKTYLEGQGVFEHPGATANTTAFFLSNIGFPSIPQVDWNIDTFIAGSNNRSGITLDFKKVQTAVFEFDGKNNGNVKFGFLIGDIVYLAHKFEINNFVDNTKTLSLPVREEVLVAATTVARTFGLYNTESGYGFASVMTTTAAPTLVVDQTINSIVCYNVGASNVRKKIPFVAGNKENYVDVSAADTPLFSIQCKDTFSSVVNRTTYNLDQLQVNAASQDENFGCYIKILYNATLVDDAFVDLPDNADSAIEYDISATSVSDGVELFCTEVMANKLSTFNMKDIFNDYRNEFSRNEILGNNTGVLVQNQTLTVVASPMLGVINTTNLDVSANIVGGEVG